MKKFFFILLLSLFTLGLNASESDGNCMTRGTGPGYEPVVGDVVKRPVICSYCDTNSGWVVVGKDDDTYSYECLNCGSPDQSGAN